MELLLRAWQSVDRGKCWSLDWRVPTPPALVPPFPLFSSHSPICGGHASGGQSPGAAQTSRVGVTDPVRSTAVCVSSLILEALSRALERCVLRLQGSYLFVSASVPVPPSSLCTDRNIGGGLIGSLAVTYADLGICLLDTG